MNYTPFIISVCHQKGGVGKTTTVSSLGASLGEMNFKVLVVDLDPSANLTTGLGFVPKNITKTAADILLGNDGLSNITHQTPINSLDLIPSSSEMAMVSRFLYLRKNYELILKDAFESAAHQYDFIIFDCPPSTGSMTICALTASNLAIIPLQCEYYALQSLKSVMKAINSNRERTNPYLSFQLLITMFDRRGKFHTLLLEQIKEYYPDALFDTIIGFDTKLRESQLFGVPITTHASSTRAAQQYRQLAKEVLGYSKYVGLREGENNKEKTDDIRILERISSNR